MTKKALSRAGFEPALPDELDPASYHSDRDFFLPGSPLFLGIRKNGALLILFRGDERQRKGPGGFMIGERGGGTTRRIHIRNRQHEHKRNLELRIETKRTTSILGAEVYEEWLFGPFRPVVRTSSFHVEDTGSIPVRDRYSFPAAFS